MSKSKPGVSETEPQTLNFKNKWQVVATAAALCKTKS